MDFSLGKVVNWRVWGSFFIFFICAIIEKSAGIIVSIKGTGNVQGFRDSSTNSYSFLGIPYAKAPVGNLRFMPPERHEGWNTTLDASQFGPNCIQPSGRGRISEDCLFLNIWSPQYAPGHKSLLPVIVLIIGDLYSFFDASLYNGGDLAARDVIVVTFNWRLSVFGFLSFEDPKAGGNMGLLDQYLAIEWIHENIREFGGDPSKIVLLGHSSGASSVMFHMTSPRASTGRFQSIILMSGSSLSPWALGYKVRDASLQLAREVGCNQEYTDEILHCLRYQDTNKITQAYYRILEYFNNTDVFGPVVDNFLPKDLQYIARSPWEAMERGEFPKIPIITGISSKDGLLMIKRRPQIYRMNYLELKRTFENEIIPQLLERSNYNRNWMIVKEVIKFAFITGTSNDTHVIMDQMLDFFTESNFLAPHIQTAKFLSRFVNPVYSYVFDQDTPDPHIYTNSINSTGAWHGSILIYLFGRSSFMELIGRDFTGVERAVSNRIQELLTNFAVTKSPTQISRQTSGSHWLKFTPNEPVHFWMRDGRTTPRGYQPYRTQFWTEFLPKLNLLGFSNNRIDEDYGSLVTQRSSQGTGYKSATWTLVAFVLVLFGVVLLLISVLRKRRKEEEFMSRETSPEVTGSRSPVSTPNITPRRNIEGRRPRNQDQGVTILY